jgi:prevent-host-death family protein
MPTYSVAEAKRSFSDLVRRAEASEEVIITRRGKVMVSMTARTPVRAEPLAPAC